MREQRLVPDEVLSEFKSVELGDARLGKRLERVVRQVAASPGASFPAQMTSTAEREALYRFLGNEQVTLEGLLAPHVAETHNRIVGSKLVRIAHDTTSLAYGGDRDGLGSVHRRGKGFFAHCALAVTADEERHPLGVLGVRTFVHTETKERQKLKRSEQSIHCHRSPRETKASSRWEKLAVSVNAAFPADVQAIHVMDQEADDFALLAELVEHNLRFVVRGSGTRVTAVAGQCVAGVLAGQRGRLFRTVRLNRRPQTKEGRRSPRGERDAHLAIRWSRLQLRRPGHCKVTVRELELTVVHVYEPKPPPNEERIEWFLLTNERVATLGDAAQVVDHYRARWVVEEFFKALKTGCAIEKRQLKSYDALVRALGLFLPIAWKLLALRSIANDPAPKPAAALFEPDDVRLVRVLLSERRTDHQLPKAPTVRDVMLAIAAIGGHIRNNGDPGWLVLGRGFQLYVDARAVWRAARSDQS